MQKIKIFYGGWYQRTTLHLDEIYDFIISGKTKSRLNENKLRMLRERMELVEVVREINYVECLCAKTKEGITLRYYEDGLYVLEIESADAKKSKATLEKYFKQKFNPAIEYLFSLGAPTPKILANIRSSHTVVVATKNSKGDWEEFLKKIGQVHTKTETKALSTYISDGFIVLAVSKNGNTGMDELVENVIFFREFKGQLEKYLQIHRILWEEIAKIKEQKKASKEEIGKFRGQLDDYRTAIALIDSRIKQMDPYLRTRASISRQANIESTLSELFQYKFESLLDALEYIKEIWRTTSEYLNASIQDLIEIGNQSLTRQLQALQLIVSVGVALSIMSYLVKDKIFQLTFSGIIYFFIIIAIAGLINRSVTKFYTRKKYALRLGEEKKED